MHVLIVDDNASKRIVIRLLLESYQEENPSVNFKIDEAENGLKAVQKAQITPYKMIFMDIMMPEMNGIEATKEIREFDKKVLIIAASAVEDDQQKQIMLKSGAEDYISKPINGPIFKTRLTNYIKLVESRFNLLKNVNFSKIHIGKDSVYPHYKRFYGKNEDALSHFWECYLLSDKESFEGISDVVRFIYDLGALIIEQDGEISIYEEENEDSLYFTVKSNAPFDADNIMKLADKNCMHYEYQVEDGVISVKFPKKAVQLEETVKRDDTKIHYAVDEERNSQIQPARSQTMQTYNILDSDDLLDLEEFLSSLNSILLVMGNSGIEKSDCDNIITALTHISRVLSAYNEFYTLSQALSHLSADIHEHEDNFIDKSAQLSTLSKAFGADLAKWYQALFKEGAPSVDFLDDSIVSNAHMISQFIQDSHDTNENNAALDDIFDF